MAQKIVGGVPFDLVMVADPSGTPVNPGGGGSSVDRELVITTYTVKTAFSGASVNDTVTLTQVIDVSGTPSTVTSIWRNQTTGADLSPAPSAANLTLVGSNALTDGQLRAAPVPIDLPALVRYTPLFERVTGAGTIAAGARAITVANVGTADGTIAGGAVLKVGEIPTWDAVSGADYDSLDYDATGTEFVIIKAV